MVTNGASLSPGQAQELKVLGRAMRAQGQTVGMGWGGRVTKPFLRAVEVEGPQTQTSRPTEELCHILHSDRAVMESAEKQAHTVNTCSVGLRWRTTLEARHGGTCF